MASIRRAYLNYRGAAERPPSSDAPPSTDGGNARIGLRSVLNPALLAGYPVALLRYVTLSPALFGAVFGSAFVLDFVLEGLAAE